jgi:hypothetical protein
LCKTKKGDKKILTWIVFQTSMGVTEQGFGDVKGRWRGMDETRSEIEKATLNRQTEEERWRNCLHVMIIYNKTYLRG